MNVLYFSCHSVLEYDELRVFRALGHDVFSLGGYIEPSTPHESIRPGLDMPNHPELKALVDGMDTEDNLDAAKCHTPQGLLDWADVIVVNGVEHRWLVPQWKRLRDKRVIWRTIGQSVVHNERLMQPLVKDGLEVVRYSPLERNIPSFCGETALIRFAKDPLDWYGWTGDDAVVINFTQHLAQRDPYTNWGFWREATKGLPAVAAGAGSEDIGGLGSLPYDLMRQALRQSRAYVVTNTQPASYTLGAIEAGLTGVPIVSIGASWMGIDYGGHTSEAMFEVPELVPLGGYDDPAEANKVLRRLLSDHAYARAVSVIQRARFMELFGSDRITRQWGELLGPSEGMGDAVTRTAQPQHVEPVRQVVAPVMVSMHGSGVSA